MEPTTAPAIVQQWQQLATRAVGLVHGFWYGIARLDEAGGAIHCRTFLVETIDGVDWVRHVRCPVSGELHADMCIRPHRFAHELAGGELYQFPEGEHPPEAS